MWGPGDGIQFTIHQQDVLTLAYLQPITLPYSGNAYPLEFIDERAMPNPCDGAMDSDNDGDIDLADYSVLQNCLDSE